LLNKQFLKLVLSSGKPEFYQKTVWTLSLNCFYFCLWQYVEKIVTLLNSQWVLNNPQKAISRHKLALISYFKNIDLP
jgi:hypothetical protein